MKSSLARWMMAALPLLLGSLLLAQDPPTKPPPGRKPPVEEEEKKPKKPPVEEEKSTKPPKAIPREDDDSKPPKKPIPREDDTMPPKKPTPAASGPLDLAGEAAAATHPDVKRLFQSVAIPADRIQLRKNTDLIQVDPLPQYIGARANSGQITYSLIGPDGKPMAAKITVNPGEIVKAVSYEEHALEETSNFLIDMERYPAGNARYLPPLTCLVAADKVLTAIHKYHDAARAAEKRRGPGWDAVKDHLMAKYQDVLSDELKALIAGGDKNADRAADVADRMATLFPDSLQAEREIQMWKLSLVNNDLSRNDSEYISASGALQKLMNKHPGADPKILEPLRDALRKRAQAHFDEAVKLRATEDGKPSALRQADMALKIWAELPGLRDFQQQLARDFRLLIVGVKQLPELMSPALAVTDADRWAVELLFESLVKPVPDGVVGQRYQAGLARRMPRTIAMGREFELPRAEWIDQEGKTDKLDSSDVRGTLAMLQSPECSRLPVAENIDLLSEPVVQDAFRFPLRLERGCLDPLAAMTFKVLPARLLAGKPDKLLNREFALKPVGSGPFVYHGRRTEDGREYAVFKSNPAYSKREGKFGLPRIQEIRFVVTPADPAPDLREGRIDLLLDVSTAEMMRLRDPKFELSTTVADQTLSSRRIWMLAVNHRNQNLSGDVGRPLRRAIAFAINRDEILRIFKAGQLVHQEMNGPFPPNTWAGTAVTTTSRLYRPEHAQSEASRARKPERLTLRFVDDPLARQACTLIKQQVAQVGINLELVPQNSADFHRDVMLEHNYELAYLPYDYGNELYSLRGLFDNAVGRGERNFLGYQPESQIGQLLTMIQSTRDFGRVRDAMHRLNDPFESAMPFIPLWQLDFHLVRSRKLETVPAAADLDPRTVFDMVEEWRLER
jgi:peptide/nickel transport system substrate-binding protein